MASGPSAGGEDPPEPAPGRAGEVARLGAKLGLIAFGGPAAHVAMLHDEVVTRRGWIGEQRFLDMLGATNLIPGPNSTEMVMHVGHTRAGVRGLVAAGASFILPAATIVAAIAWGYVRYGQTPAGEALLYGVKPVVIAIVAQALVRLGRTAATTWPLALLGVVTAAAYLAGVNELVVLAAGALAAVAARRVPTGGAAAVLVLPLAQVAEPLDLPRLFAVFVKVGAVLYGSGYVLLAFLQGDLVDRLGVLTTTQLVDAVAVGQFTPGPVFTTATFVGYVLAGLPGAVVATVAIFLPSFVLVGLLARILPRIRDRAWAADLLDGVNVAALGLMAGVTLELARASVVDRITAAALLAAAVVLWRWRVNSAWLVLAGAALGLSRAAL